MHLTLNFQLSELDACRFLVLTCERDACRFQMYSTVCVFLEGGKYEYRTVRYAKGGAATMPRTHRGGRFHP